MRKSQRRTAPNVIDLGTRRGHRSGTPCPAPSSGVATMTQLKEADAKFAEAFEKFDRIGVGIVPCESLRPLSIRKRKAATRAALAVSNVAVIVGQIASDSIGGAPTMSSGSRLLLDRMMKAGVIIVLMKDVEAAAIETGDERKITRLVILAKYLAGSIFRNPGGGRPLEEDEDHGLLPADAVEDPWPIGAA